MKWLLLIALAALGIILGAVFYGPHLYQGALSLRLMHAAEVEAAKGHREQAIHFYDLSLHRNPDNLKVLHFFAAYLTKLHHPGELEVLRRIHTLEPKNSDATLELASAELTFGRVTDALHILAAADPQARTQGRYYHLISMARFMSGALPEADAACAEALKLEPGNKVYLANQATIELSSPSETMRQAALDRLEKLAKDERTALTALRSLLRYAVKNANEPPHLDAWLQAFQHHVGPRDYLFTLRLEVLHRFRPEDFSRELPQYLQNASRDSQSASAAVNWLVGQHLAIDVLSFRDSVPVEWQNKMNFLTPAAQAFFELGQMEKIEGLLQAPAWKSYPADELAWRERLRRARRAPGAPTDLDALSWRKVLAPAGGNGPALARLLELARQWGWPAEYTATLWAVAQGVPGGSADALGDLFNFDLRTGDSRDLLRVVKQQVETEPNNPVHLNNLAFLSLLLEAEATQGEAVAKALCARFPKNPAFTATLAFAYFKKGNPGEGLELFRGLDTSALRGTAPGATYGLLLAAEGNKEAADFLQDAEAWMRLPEERKLLDEARRKIAAKEGGAGSPVRTEEPIK